ncbi:MAG: ComEC/Rec2 family competence protein [Tepidisphaeraceae bacterium]
MEQRSPPTLGLIAFFQARPAVIFGLLLAVGIGFSDLFPCKPWLWLIIAAALLILAPWVRWPLAGAALLGGATFWVGLSAAQIEQSRFPSDNISNYTADVDEFAQLELAIDQPPRLLAPSPAELRALLPKQTAVATVRAIDAIGGWRSASGRIFLTIEHPNPRLAPGQIVRVTGLLQRPSGPMNPGQFDFSAWCRDQRILATFKVGHADGVEILEDNGPSPLTWLREKSRHLLAMGFDADRAFDHALLRAFVFGDSDPQLRDLEEKFVRTGTVHNISISGLHVAIIGAITLLICRLLRCSPRLSILVALAVVLLYASVALPSWPGWRSIILFTAATFGTLGRRWVDTLQMFALAVATVLFIHPADLCSPGFQISFAAVLGMILFSPMAGKYFWNWWRGQDRPTPVPHNMLVTILKLVWRVFVAVALASCVAWGASMPLIAYHFGQLNAWAVPAGVALLPLTVVALVAGVGKILLTLAWPSAAHAWAAATVLPIVCMRHAVDAVDRLPGATVAIPPFSIGLLISYYALFALLFIPIRRKIWRWLARAASAVACATLLLLPAVAGGVSPQSFAPTEPLRITLVSLGAGQCAIVRPTHSHAVLIDVGSSTISDLAGTVLLPCLRAENCPIVDKILLSHGDFDHVSAAAEIFDKFNQPPVYTSPHFARHAVGNIPAESLLKTLEDALRPPTLIHQGDHLDLGNGAAINVLWPPLLCDMNSNDCGLVLKLTFCGKAVLFPADIQVAPERELLKHPELLRADVLVAPHHGSAEMTTGDFLRAVHPQFILASNDSKLTHKQKLFDVLAEDYPLYRTSRCGAIDVTIEPSGEIEIETYLGVGPRERTGQASRLK